MGKITRFAFQWAILFVATVSYAQSSRLVGWWKMDEVPGATSLADASGNGRNATLG